MDFNSDNNCFNNFRFFAKIHDKKFFTGSEYEHTVFATQDMRSPVKFLYFKTLDGEISINNGAIRGLKEVDCRDAINLFNGVVRKNSASSCN